MEILDRALLLLMREEIEILKRLIVVKQKLMVLRSQHGRTARRPRASKGVGKSGPDEQVAQGEKPV